MTENLKKKKRKKRDTERSNGFGSQLELYGKPIKNARMRKTKSNAREARLFARRVKEPKPMRDARTGKKAIVSIIFFVSVNLPLSLRSLRR